MIIKKISLSGEAHQSQHVTILPPSGDSLKYYESMRKKALGKDRICLLLVCLCCAGDELWTDKSGVGSLNGGALWVEQWRRG